MDVGSSGIRGGNRGIEWQKALVFNNFLLINQFPFFTYDIIINIKIAI